MCIFSPKPIFETDENSYVLVTLPLHNSVEVNNDELNILKKEYEKNDRIK